MKVKEEIGSLATAFTFFTRLPLRVRAFYPEGSLTYLPVVTLLLGGLLYILDVFLTHALSPDLRALVLLFLQYFLANYFHFDGLVDTLDALGASGDRERRLGLLKTPDIGALGFLFGFFFLLGEFLFLEALLSRGLSDAVFFKPLSGRLGLLLGVIFGRAARPEGLGQLFLSLRAKRRAVPALIFLAVLLLWFHPVSALSILIGGLLATFYFRYKFGGLTGDHLGALVQLSELLFLVSLSFPGSTSGIIN